ncbi:MAG: hypothetical protein WC635_06205 [Bacteriovorax sp.]|jgi:hypothetical protein
MKKLLILTSLILSGSAFSATNVAVELVKNISGYNCERTLDVLLERNAEASRLSNEGMKRYNKGQEDAMMRQLFELSDARYIESDAVKAHLIEKCFIK